MYHSSILEYHININQIVGIMPDNTPNELPEDLNEDLLQSVALTFSSDGISKDLKNFIQKKLFLTTNVFRDITQLASSFTKSSPEVQALLTDTESPISVMLKDSFKEVQITNKTLNKIVKNTLEQEYLLRAESLNISNVDAPEDKE